LRLQFVELNAHLGGDAIRLRVDARHQRPAQLREVLAQRGAVGERPERRRRGSLPRQRRGSLPRQGRGPLLHRSLRRRFERRRARLLVGTPLGNQAQLVEHLGDIRRSGLLRQHADRAECAHLTEEQLTLLGGVHHDRDGGGTRVVLDGPHRLQSVHARHQVIHEDHVRVVATQVLDRRLGALCIVDVDVVLLESAGEKQAC
jgi:hypothetical protein